MICIDELYSGLSEQIKKSVPKSTGVSHFSPFTPKKIHRHALFSTDPGFTIFGSPLIHHGGSEWPKRGHWTNHRWV